MKEGLKGIKNFEDVESYYRFYLKECESENIKLLHKIDRYENTLKECINQDGLMNFLDENEWATQEDYFVKIAKEALYK